MHGKKKQYFRCLQQFRKNTVEQQWLVWLLLLQKAAVFSEIEQSDCIRSDVAAGAEIVRSIDKLTHLHSFLDFFHHLKRPCVRGHSYKKRYSHLHFHAESV